MLKIYDILEFKKARKWKEKLTGHVPPFMILSKEKAGGMPDMGPEEPDLSEASIFSLPEPGPWMEPPEKTEAMLESDELGRSEGSSTYFGRVYVMDT